MDVKSVTASITYFLFSVSYKKTSTHIWKCWRTKQVLISFPNAGGSILSNATLSTALHDREALEQAARRVWVHINQAPLPVKEFFGEGSGLHISQK